MNEPHQNGPQVSVVMPVYNGQRYLELAVHSILDQSFRDLELVVVDDGSTDDSSKILVRLAAADQRVKILRRANAGIVAALNDGIAAARGPFIARMDADDIALPHRIQRQLRFMQQHPECVVVGSAMVNIDPDGDPIAEQHFPLDHESIERQLLRGIGGIAHPTSLIRAQALHRVGGYRFKYQWVEDKDLWLRLAELGRLANLPEVLLQYRLHLESVCHQRSREQARLMRRLLAEAYRRRSELLTSSQSSAAAGSCHALADAAAAHDDTSHSADVEPSDAPARASANSTAAAAELAGVRHYRSTAEVHVHWSNWALTAGNFQTARKHAWSAVRARPCGFDAWPLLVRALLRVQQPTGLLRGVRRWLAGPSSRGAR